jgi:hypothetical protein
VTGHSSSSLPAFITIELVSPNDQHPERRLALPRFLSYGLGPIHFRMAVFRSDTQDEFLKRRSVLGLANLDHSGRLDIDSHFGCPQYDTFSLHLANSVRLQRLAKAFLQLEAIGSAYAGAGAILKDHFEFAVGDGFQLKDAFDVDDGGAVDADEALRVQFFG